MTKTIIFDYDGTIHHTLGIYEPAFRETYQWLTEQKVTEEREIGSVEIAGWLGLNSKEMWNTFLPELDQSYKEQASRMVGDLMVRQIRKHKAVWYPGAEEMLTALKNRGYHLVILSNCKASYREAHWKEFGMERWFDHFMTANRMDSVQRQRLCRKSFGNIQVLIWWSETGGRIWNVPEPAKAHL